ncbi:MAG: hypothetical protein KDC49_13885 [Saprospiraceae bacterium]|nr:hypothetical protein [Saprospiraceae bacterium]
MSRRTLYFIYFLVCIASFLYFPKWKLSGTEATLSWDTAGYYWYLPATFIYDDLELLAFSQDILDKYQNTSHFYQAFEYENGNMVMKYPMGMALQFLPFFLIAHFIAPILGFSADGFSLPYQFAIHLESFLFALFGLWFLRKILLNYFSEKLSSLVLISVYLGTNYLSFSSIENAMTHNYLFTWNAFLIYNTIKYNQERKLKYILFIGLSLGISILTRPTEIVSALIPLFWNFDLNRGGGWKAWFTDLAKQWRHVLLVGGIVFAFGFFQLLYYKLIGGDWLIYAYQDQGFSFLSPHVYKYLFSYEVGWLLYNPLFFLVPFGLMWAIKSRKEGSVAMLIYVTIYLYVVTAWDYWLYGARAMVQSYAVLGIFLGFAFEKLLKQKVLKWALGFLIIFCFYYNLWWTHGVHRGAYYDAYNSTKAYFKHTFLRWRVPLEYKKLYDADEIFIGERQAVNVLKFENFENDSIVAAKGFYLNNSVCDAINSNLEFSQPIVCEIQKNENNWLRVSADFYTEKREGDLWKMPQMVVQIKMDDHLVKRSFFRTSRILSECKIQKLYLDVKKPDEPFNKLEALVWSAYSDKLYLIDNVRVDEFR